MKQLSIFVLSLLLLGCSSNQKEKNTTSVITDSTSTIELSDTLTESNQPQEKKTIRRNTTETISFSELTKAILPKPQIFQINPNQDTVITGRQGTKLLIPANSLKSDDPSIKISLREAYTSAEMIRNGLKTMSNGKVITSNGMIELRPLKGNVTINPNAPLEVLFPTQNTVESDLFYADNTGNWQPQSQPTSPVTYQEVEIIDYIEKDFDRMIGAAIPYKGQDTLDKYVSYPPYLQRKNLAGNIIVKVDIDEEGIASNAHISRGIDKELDKIILDAVKKITVWCPSFLNGDNLPSTMRLSFRVTGKNKGYKIFYPKEIKQATQKEQIVEDWLQYQKEGQILIPQKRIVYRPGRSTDTTKKYRFTLNNWGWINCDYFDNVPAINRTNIVGQLDNEASYQLIVYRGKGKSVLNNYTKKEDEFQFSKVDNRRSYAIISVKKSNGDLYFASKKFKGSNSKDIKLKYKKITLRELNSELEKLDKN